MSGQGFWNAGDEDSALLTRGRTRSAPVWLPGRGPEEGSRESAGQRPPALGVSGTNSRAALPRASEPTCPLEFQGWLPQGRFLHGLHGLLHVHDELGGLPALGVDSHRLDALHVV